MFPCVCSHDYDLNGPNVGLWLCKYYLCVHVYACVCVLMRECACVLCVMFVHVCMYAIYLCMYLFVYLFIYLFIYCLRFIRFRHLEHSTIIFEEPQHTPLLRLAWNKQDPNYLATFSLDSLEVIM